jgi:hypothetical protein
MAHLLLGDRKSLWEEKSLKSRLLGDWTRRRRLLLAAVEAATILLVSSWEAGEGDLYLNITIRLLTDILFKI